MSRFEVSEWADAEGCKEYQDNADHYVVERRTLLDLLVSFYRSFLGTGRGNTVLDLGCGDGALGGALRDADPTVQIIAVDGAQEMLASARARFGGQDRVSYRLKTFQQIIAEGSEWTSLDLVASGFAIHHLDREEKLSLFRRIKEMLRAGGYFANIDIVLPDSRSYEDWYYALWRDWIEDRQKRLSLPSDLRNVPAEARAKPENRYESLGTQLDLLRTAGFTETECFYRYGLFGIYGGRRPCE